MVTSNYIVFGTAWRDGLSLIDNLKRQALLTETLVNHNLQFEACVGRYKASEEQSFAIAVHSQAIAKQVARHLGAVFQQECIGLLEVSTMEFSLVYPNGLVPEVIGKMQTVTGSEAFRADAATYWRGLWWVAQ